MTGSAPDYRKMLSRQMHDYFVMARDTRERAKQCGVSQESLSETKAADEIERLQAEVERLTAVLREIRRDLQCTCHEAWTGRGRHETHCRYDIVRDMNELIGPEPAEPERAGS